MTFELHAYDLTTGAYITDLPDFQSASFGFAYSAFDGALKVDYPGLGHGYGILGNDLDLRLTWDGQPVDDGCWISRGSAGDIISEQGANSKITILGRHLSDAYRKIVLLPITQGQTKATFTNVTPGTVIKAILNTAGTAPRSAWGATAIDHSTFNGLTDSAGSAWSYSNLTFEFPIGTTALQVLQNLQSRGYLEARLVGRSLRLYNRVNYGVTRNNIKLSIGENITELPFKKSTEDKVSHILVQGDDGIWTVRGVGGAARREEGFISESGISQINALQDIGDQALFSLSIEQEQRIVKINGERTQVPGVHYKAGDWIVLDGGVPDSLRVRQMTIEVDKSGGYAASIVLNDRILEKEIARARLLSAVSGGLSVGSTGNGTVATRDTNVPKTPTGLAGTSAAYLDSEGRGKALVTLTWVAPSLNTDNSPLTDLANFRVYMRTDSDTAKYTLMGVADADETSFTIGELPTKVWRRFALRAYDSNGHGSPVSAEFRIQTAYDLTAPPPTSAPLLSSRLGTVTVRWDGKDEDGNAMPPDTETVRVHRSTGEGFTADLTNMVGEMTGNGSIVFTGLDYTQRQYFKFVAVDTRGNTSDPSAEAWIDIVRIAGPDIQANSVTANEIQAGAIQAEHISIGAVPATGMQLGPNNLILDPSFEEELIRNARPPVTPFVYEQGVGLGSEGDWYLRCPGNGVTHIMPMTLGVMPVQSGDRYYLRSKVRTTATTGTARVALQITQPDSTVVGYAEDVPTLVAGFVVGSTWVIIEGVVTVPNLPDGRYAVPVIVVDNNATTGQWYFDQVECWNVLSSTSPTGHSMEVGPQGFRLFDENGDLASSFTSQPPNFLSIYNNGELQASMSQDGGIVGNTLDIRDEIYIGGVPLIGSFDDDVLENGLGVSDSLLNTLPRSVQGWSLAGIDKSFGQTDFGFIEVAWDADPNRMYHIHFSSYVKLAVADSAVQVYFHDKAGGAVPRITDTILNSAVFTGPPVANEMLTVNLNYYGTFAAGVHRTLVSAKTLYGGTTGFFFNGTGYLSNLVVQDVGPIIAQSGAYNTGGGTYTTGGSTTPPPPTADPPDPIKTYTTRYGVNWGRTWKQDGSVNTVAGGEAIQGYYSGLNGNQKAMLGFADETIRANLAGATVKSCKLYLYANHWYNNAGGTAIIGTHNVDEIPGSFSGNTDRIRIGDNEAKWPKPGGRVVNLGTTIGNEFKNNTAKGITLGPGPSTSHEYYGKFKISGGYLEFTYTK